MGSAGLGFKAISTKCTKIKLTQMLPKGYIVVGTKIINEKSLTVTHMARCPIYEIDPKINEMK